MPSAGDVDFTMRIVPVDGSTTGSAIWPRIASADPSSPASGPWTSTYRKYAVKSATERGVIGTTALNGLAAEGKV